MEREDFIQGLREFADFLETHEDVPSPVWEETIYRYVDDEDKVKAAARTGDSWVKDYGTDTFRLKRRFGNGAITYSINCEREKVCEKKIVGTEVQELVDEEWIREQYRHIRETAPKIPTEVEIVEWDCKPLLADKGD